jgi:hypothetical protein
MVIYGRFASRLQKEMGLNTSIVFIRDRPIFSSERMLHMDYYRKSSVEKKIRVVGLKGPDATMN